MPRSDAAINPTTGLSGFDHAHTMKLRQINAACDTALNLLKRTYPPGEVESWDKQEREAVAYKADVSTPTPLLTALSESRGVLLSELVERVIAKAETYAMLSGTIIGQRQRLEDELDRAEDAASIAAIDVIINPGGGLPCVTG